jgi:CRP-like cAMP-binding protein
VVLSIGTPAGGNRLLAAVARSDRGRILDTCEAVELDFGHTLADADSLIRHVHFPVTGYISLITPRDASESLEVGLVGNEGGFGVTLMLGVNVSPLKGLVQGQGSALRMSTADFRAALRTSRSFASVMNAYLFVLFGQIAQTAACGRFHHLEARLARWILMTHDRAGTSTFAITHQFLAHMLGVRRPGVTEAAGALQDRKMIYYRRGAMQVINRPALEALACPCYKRFNAMYTKHLGSK